MIEWLVGLTEIPVRIEQASPRFPLRPPLWPNEAFSGERSFHEQPELQPHAAPELSHLDGRFRRLVFKAILFR